MSEDRKPPIAIAADTLRKMAERCDLNASGDFGGVMVIIPPQGNPIEVLVLDSRQNVGQFWGIIQSQATLALKELEDLERQSGTFGRR